MIGFGTFLLAILIIGAIATSITLSIHWFIADNRENFKMNDIRQQRALSRKWRD